MDRLVEKKGGAGSSSVEMSGFVSTAKESLLYFIENNFPTEVKQDNIPQASAAAAVMSDDFGDAGFGLGGATVRAPPPPSVIIVDQRCVKLKAAALASAEDLTLPGAPLDRLIDALGGPDRVAEMTVK